ncbi:type II toxin-antitoxin system RelE/ParE family toxin [Mesorhizobium sp. B2-3-4]|uniref:type II toxin-antitoxin system RelE/ParE family toxin n=1 Tax=Mesorhizobium sp. B2-3-4 TaxID=2589959 RepID=UPI001FED6543|nr:type II toxin-antitoxin system RelE/ParE family toxin [Mesorhizobium sp. B2-3-4]
MTHKVVFRPLARSDLFAIYSYIEKESGAARAGGYIERIEAACMALSYLPGTRHRSRRHRTRHRARQCAAPYILTHP